MVFRMDITNSHPCIIEHQRPNGVAINITSLVTVKLIPSRQDKADGVGEHDGTAAVVTAAVGCRILYSGVEEAVPPILS